jgi:thiamine biosynthesis lipoprotein
LAALLLAIPAAAEVTEIHYVMGTYLRITVDDSDSPALRATMRRCFATARDLDARFSRFQPESELSRLNAVVSREEPVHVSGEMAALLRAAVELRAKTNGAFDVGAGAVTNLWRTATEWPDVIALARARNTSGADALRISGDEVRRHAGVLIDVDGIAKGWTVDRCVMQLRADGVRRAFLSFGESSIYALGTPRNAHGWPMTVRSLDGARAAGVLTLRDQALSVSAVFGHEHVVGTRRVGHIVDPRSGLPLTAPGMVAVVATSATAAEAYSKALLIDADSAARALRDGSIDGALWIEKHRTRRAGTLAFEAAARNPRIAQAAEALR